jgi:hypothetical protein
MIYLAVSAVVPVVAVGTLVARLWPRRAISSVAPRTPLVFAHVRVLRDAGEVREVADRAYAREQTILAAAQRRAARFGELTQLPRVPDDHA